MCMDPVGRLLQLGRKLHFWKPLSLPRLPSSESWRKNTSIFVSLNQCHDCLWFPSNERNKNPSTVLKVMEEYKITCVCVITSSQACFCWTDRHLCFLQPYVKLGSGCLTTREASTSTILGPQWKKTVLVLFVHLSPPFYLNNSCYYAPRSSRNK